MPMTVQLEKLLGCDKVFKKIVLGLMLDGRH
jgi:hypothetical protein